MRELAALQFVSGHVDARDYLSLVDVILSSIFFFSFNFSYPKAIRVFHVPRASV